MRLELTTSSLPRRCSTTELPGQFVLYVAVSVGGFACALDLPERWVSLTLYIQWSLFSLDACEMVVAGTHMRPGSAKPPSERETGVEPATFSLES